MKLYLSLGAGVQSTTLLLLSYHGELPLLDGAIFADTGWEPQAVYDHLAWLESFVPARIPIYRVSGGNIRDDTLAAVAGARRGFAELPFYSYNKRGGKAQIKRQCTTTYKTTPVNRLVRKLCGYSKRRWQGAPVDLWIGISLDEAHRMKPAREPWLNKVYPLVDLRWRRSDCLAWLRAQGYHEPPKSACKGCPFHSKDGWRRQKENPADWADVTAFDQAIRTIPRWNQPVYLHSSRLPLVKVDLSTPQERGQLEMDLDGECGGSCGL